MRRVEIICGISGSGKSTHVSKLLAESDLSKGGVVCSADQYFTDKNGKYNFNPADLPKAHGSCLRKFVERLQMEVGLIVVDNTNTSVGEVAPYAALALAYDYDLNITIIRCDPVVAAKRNVHGVPLPGVMGQFTRLAGLKEALPPWWPVREVKAEM